jgi:holdfast attachment protein HfaA
MCTARPITSNRSAALILPLTAAIAASALAVALPAAAQSGAEFNSGYGGRNYNRNVDPAVRDQDSNQIFINGRMRTPEGSVFADSDRVARSGGVGGAGRATAIGNNLEVVVVGSWNRVTVESTQVNNGTISAQTALNGSLDLE